MRKHFLFIISIVITATLPAYAQMPPPALTPSLFFNDEELDVIDKEVRKAPRPLNRDAVTLGAVLYYGPNNWTVWLRGEKWTPETDRPNLRILDVTPDSVRLSLTPHEGAKPQTIMLRPYQTYNVSSGRVS